MPADPPPHVTAWDAAAVAAWLRENGFGDLERVFVDNEITGDVLVHLSHDTLRDLSVWSVGRRIAILRAVYDVKVRHRVPVESDEYTPASAKGPFLLATTPTDSLGSATAVVSSAETPAAGCKMLSPGFFVGEELARLDATLHAALRERDETFSRLAAEVHRLDAEMQRARDDILSLRKVLKEREPLPVPEQAKLNLTDIVSQNRRMQVVTSETPNSAGWKHAKQPTGSGLPSPFPDQPERNSTDAPSQSATTQAHPSEKPNSAVSKHVKQQSTSDLNTSSDLLINNFRISPDDPCHRVLAAALKKYKASQDWQQYALFIVHGENGKHERRLDYDEKPLPLFQQLQQARENPVFVLKNLKRLGQQSSEPPSVRRDSPFPRQQASPPPSAAELMLPTARAVRTASPTPPQHQPPPVPMKPAPIVISNPLNT